jgi:hypothetical protein
MSTDGVKIIDGDTAFDTYWGIMDLYDSGATIERIRAEIPFTQPDYYDDFDYEVYTTAYALAIWEIGHMTDDILQEIRRVIEKGACVQVWTEQHSADAGKARQKELDELWTKISSENSQVRAVKVYETITNFLFEQYDVLAFRLKDNNYYVTILFRINQYRGECTYEFGKILFRSDKRPTIDDIIRSEIIGKKIPSGHGMDMTAIFALDVEEMMKKGGIEEILKREAERTGSFVIGMDKISVNHNDLATFTDKFQKIGQLNYSPNYQETSSIGGATTFDEFTREFPHLDNYINIVKADKFKISELLGS